ncbi:hypothetical protein Pcinc_016991 [Petrolisthes cinctipes]|uniref:Uncharacterized protein n=1 Tax=Petrolisthes cinctipes TaxID=88211 RepID=A0AAE1KP83_PETCI|nr:hypothetical protein Pcinc_016991 [Petrolisthes cinctipes]
MPLAPTNITLHLYLPHYVTPTSLSSTHTHHPTPLPALLRHSNASSDQVLHTPLHHPAPLPASLRHSDSSSDQTHHTPSQHSTPRPASYVTAQHTAPRLIITSRLLTRYATQMPLATPHTTRRHLPCYNTLTLLATTHATGRHAIRTPLTTHHASSHHSALGHLTTQIHPPRHATPTPLAMSGFRCQAPDTPSMPPHPTRHPTMHTTLAPQHNAAAPVMHASTLLNLPIVPATLPQQLPATTCTPPHHTAHTFLWVEDILS